MNLEFHKYQGTGNDFIILDDRKEIFNFNKLLISNLCQRRTGIGADGLILLRNHQTYDFEMIYFNSDGNQSSMCGNGGRCIVSFAKKIGLIKDTAKFKAIDGVHFAKISSNNVSLQLIDVDSNKNIKKISDLLIIDTGSPHVVKLVDDLEFFDVYNEGKKIRNSNQFEPAGVNVNFTTHISESFTHVRTYERGVENETLSCGTGVVAVAIALHNDKIINNDYLKVSTKGGELAVSFNFINGTYKNIWLTGDVKLVYSGNFSC